MVLRVNKGNIKRLLKYSNKAARIQTQSPQKAEEYLVLLDSEVSKLRENNFKFLCLCDGNIYQNPVGKNAGYFRPLFAMSTHKKIKEAKADDTNAVDFDVPIGTRVYSVESGVVTAIKNDAVEGGNNPQYAGKDNFLYIYNNAKDKMYCYRHINPEKSILQNSIIKKGQYLGEVGMTGYTISSHLHFAIYKVDRKSKYILKSLSIKFC